MELVKTTPEIAQSILEKGNRKIEINMLKLWKWLFGTRKQQCNINDVSVSVASSDVGKCATCRFNDEEWDRCVVGTYWAEKGLNKICYEGELWETTER